MNVRIEGLSAINDDSLEHEIHSSLQSPQAQMFHLQHFHDHENEERIVSHENHRLQSIDQDSNSSMSETSQSNIDTPLTINDRKPILKSLKVNKMNNVMSQDNIQEVEEEEKDFFQPRQSERPLQKNSYLNLKKRSNVLIEISQPIDELPKLMEQKSFQQMKREFSIEPRTMTQQRKRPTWEGAATTMTMIEKESKKGRSSSLMKEFCWFQGDSSDHEIGLRDMYEDSLIEWRRFENSNILKPAKMRLREQLGNMSNPQLLQQQLSSSNMAQSQIFNSNSTSANSPNNIIPSHSQSQGIIKQCLVISFGKGKGVSLRDLSKIKAASERDRAEDKNSIGIMRMRRKSCECATCGKMSSKQAKVADLPFIPIQQKKYFDIKYRIKSILATPIRNPSSAAGGKGKPTPPSTPKHSMTQSINGFSPLKRHTFLAAMENSLMKKSSVTSAVATTSTHKHSEYESPMHQSFSTHGHFHHSISNNHNNNNSNHLAVHSHHHVNHTHQSQMQHHHNNSHSHNHLHPQQSQNHLHHHHKSPLFNFLQSSPLETIDSPRNIQKPHENKTGGNAIRMFDENPKDEGLSNLAESVSLKHIDFPLDLVATTSSPVLLPQQSSTSVAGGQAGFTLSLTPATGSTNSNEGITTRTDSTTAPTEKQQQQQQGQQQQRYSGSSQSSNSKHRFLKAGSSFTTSSSSNSSSMQLYKVDRLLQRTVEDKQNRFSILSTSTSNSNSSSKFKTLTPSKSARLLHTTTTTTTTSKSQFSNSQQQQQQQQQQQPSSDLNIPQPTSLNDIFAPKPFISHRKATSLLPPSSESGTPANVRDTPSNEFSEQIKLSQPNSSNHFIGSKTQPFLPLQQYQQQQQQQQQQSNESLLQFRDRYMHSFILPATTKNTTSTRTLLSNRNSLVLADPSKVFAITRKPPSIIKSETTIIPHPPPPGATSAAPVGTASTASSITTNNNNQIHTPKASNSSNLIPSGAQQFNQLEEEEKFFDSTHNKKQAYHRIFSDQPLVSSRSMLTVRKSLDGLPILTLSKQQQSSKSRRHFSITDVQQQLKSARTEQIQPDLTATALTTPAAISKQQSMKFGCYFKQNGMNNNNNNQTNSPAQAKNNYLATMTTINTMNNSMNNGNNNSNERIPAKKAVSLIPSNQSPKKTYFSTMKSAKFVAQQHPSNNPINKTTTNNNLTMNPSN